MKCPFCAEEISEGVLSCPFCQRDLPAGLWPAKVARTSGLATASLIVSILGVCSAGTLGLVGLALGLIALRRINRSGGQLGGRGLAVAGIVVGALMSLAAVALGWPALLDFRAKSKRAEVKANLKEIAALEQGYYKQHRTYADSFTALGWRPNGEIIYSYFLPRGEISNPSGAPGKPLEGIEPGAGATGFTAVAVGNIDEDETLDVWTIDQKANLQNRVNDRP